MVLIAVRVQVADALEDDRPVAQRHQIGAAGVFALDRGQVLLEVLDGPVGGQRMGELLRSRMSWPTGPLIRPITTSRTMSFAGATWKAPKPISTRSPPASADSVVSTSRLVVCCA